MVQSLLWNEGQKKKCWCPCKKEKRRTNRRKEKEMDSLQLIWHSFSFFALSNPLNLTSLRADYWLVAMWCVGAGIDPRHSDKQSPHFTVTAIAGALASSRVHLSIDELPPPSLALCHQHGLNWQNIQSLQCFHRQNKTVLTARIKCFSCDVSYSSRTA